MITSIQLNNRQIEVDLSKPLDISIPLRADEKNVSAWYVPPVQIEAVMSDQFVGSVKKGGSVNFRNIFFNPHGNGTHTECVGHISHEDYSINDCLKEFFFLSRLVSIQPEKQTNGDEVITLEQIQKSFERTSAKAAIIRTLPNSAEKMQRQYSNTNPPYIEAAAMQYLIDLGVEHFLIDLPSVDREMDGGILAAHHTFWEYPKNPQLNRTITELIYVPEEIEDGEYLLNLQIASFVNDATPSKPILYKIKPSH